MANLTSIKCGVFRIPLPVAVTDSTHGEMRAFELNTVRLTDAEGAEGVGYTFTAGRNDAAGNLRKVPNQQTPTELPRSDRKDNQSQRYPRTTVGPE